MRPMALRNVLPATCRQKGDSDGETPAARELVPDKLLVKFRILASAAKQFVMRPALDDFSAL